MTEFDQLYREVILDHYKNPRGHGLLEAPDAQAEGQNPLCGDEVTVSVRFDGDMIADVGFEGRGCAISQAATSMLTEIVVGRTAEEVARMPKEELLEEIGIPLTPVRLKCAILGLGVLKVALHKSKGTPLPDEWTRRRRPDDQLVATSVDVCPVEELPPGHVKIVWSGPIAIGVYNCNGSLYAIEDRCSHDDGPLCEGEWEEDECIAICPRHGVPLRHHHRPRADAAGLRAVPTYPVRVEDGWVRVDV